MLIKKASKVNYQIEEKDLKLRYVIPIHLFRPLINGVLNGAYYLTDLGRGLYGREALLLEWAHHTSRISGMPVLVIAPLVIHQYLGDFCEKAGYPVFFPTKGKEVQVGINIVNWEKVRRDSTSEKGGLFWPEQFIGMCFHLPELVRDQSAPKKLALINLWIQRVPRYFVTDTHEGGWNPASRWFLKHINQRRSLCNTCGKTFGAPRVDNGLAAGIHCDACWNEMLTECRSRSW